MRGKVRDKKQLRWGHITLLAFIVLFNSEIYQFRNLKNAVAETDVTDTAVKGKGGTIFAVDSREQTGVLVYLTLLLRQPSSALIKLSL